MSIAIIMITSFTLLPCPVQVAVCNLASLALNKFVTQERTFDFQMLFQITKVEYKATSKTKQCHVYMFSYVATCNISSSCIHTVTIHSDID